MLEDLSDIDIATQLQNELINHATGGVADARFYAAARARFMNSPSHRALTPAFVIQNRSTDSFWQWIKFEKQTYAERRTLIYDGFRPLLDHLEFGNSTPAIDVSDAVISGSDAESVAKAWQKATARRVNDPDGAITMARTLLETVCKHILDDRNVEYDEKDELKKLYGLTCQQLNLAPEQHGEEIFKQILGGCRSVVQGLGSLRNSFSDAHGKSKKGYSPEVRHASLAVNLSGAMATFLIETHEKTRR